jgi:arylsulfatase A-like enzyme
MVVITSDHGEEFWEHGSVGHGHSVHQELVHVPLIVYYPPLIPKGTRVEAGVDVLDVYPTILEALGAKMPDGLQGKSVLPLIHNMHGGYPEPAVATQYLIHYGMQMQQWKLYLKRGDYELFDRDSDPLEKTDVADKHPLASRFMLDAMSYFRAHRKEWEKQSWGVPSKLEPGFLERISAKSN